MFVPTFLTPTAFQIQGVGIIPFSARGLNIEVSKIPNGKVVYDVWGVAHTTARDEFDLFDVKLSCEDIWPPGFVALRKGQTYTVQLDNSFIEPINASGANGANVQTRPPTADGVEFYGPGMGRLPDATGAVWQRYAPVLTVVLFDWSFKIDEHGAMTSWDLHLLETR